MDDDYDEDRGWDQDMGDGDVSIWMTICRFLSLIQLFKAVVRKLKYTHTPLFALFCSPMMEEILLGIHKKCSVSA